MSKSIAPTSPSLATKAWIVVREVWIASAIFMVCTDAGRLVGFLLDMPHGAPAVGLVAGAGVALAYGAYRLGMWRASYQKADAHYQALAALAPVLFFYLIGSFGGLAASCFLPLLGGPAIEAAGMFAILCAFLIAITARCFGWGLKSSTD